MPEEGVAGSVAPGATRGVEQGDVLGPVLFAAAFRKPVAALRERLLVYLVEEFGRTRAEAEEKLVVGAYLLE